MAGFCQDVPHLLFSDNGLFRPSSRASFMFFGPLGFALTCLGSLDTFFKSSEAWASKDLVSLSSSSSDSELHIKSYMNFLQRHLAQVMSACRVRSLQMAKSI